VRIKGKQAGNVAQQMRNSERQLYRPMGRWNTGCARIESCDEGNDWSTEYVRRIWRREDTDLEHE